MEIRAFRRQLDEKRAVIENNLLTGRQHLGACADFLSESTPSETSSTTEASIASSGDADGQQRELSRGIRTEVARLSERWNALLHKAELWQNKLDDFLPVSFISYSVWRRNSFLPVAF